MTWLEQKLKTLEAEMHTARTAGELKVAIRYYMQVKLAVAQARAASAVGDGGRGQIPRAPRSTAAFGNPTA